MEGSRGYHVSVEGAIGTSEHLGANVGQPPQARPPIKPNVDYFCSFNFILKLMEIGLTLASLILALAFDGHGAIICIEILSALAAVTALSWCILFSLNMNARFPDFFPNLVLIYHLLMVVLMIIVTACAAYLWPQFKSSLYPEYLICTFTSLFAALLFLVDTIHSFMWARDSASDLIVYPCHSYEVTM